MKMEQELITDLQPCWQVMKNTKTSSPMIFISPNNTINNINKTNNTINKIDDIINDTETIQLLKYTGS